MSPEALELLRGLRADLVNLTEKLETILTKHEERLDAIEKGKAWILGAWAAMGLVCTLALSALNLWRH